MSCGCKQGRSAGREAVRWVVGSVETPAGPAPAIATAWSWRDRVEHMDHARLRTLLRVVLGETLEQKRFFDQALAGRTDLLGRRADGAGTKGDVLPTRWVN